MGLHKITNLNVLTVGHTMCAADIQQAFLRYAGSSLAECQFVGNGSVRVNSAQLVGRRHELIDCWKLASPP